MMATRLYLLRTMSSMNGPYSQTTTWGKLWESRFPLGCWLRWTRFFAGHRRPFLFFLLFVPLPIHVFPICSTNLDIATILMRKWRITNFIEIMHSWEITLKRMLSSIKLIDFTFRSFVTDMWFHEIYDLFNFM